MTQSASINGVLLTSAWVRVPWIGVWTLSAEFDREVETLAGEAKVSVGDRQMVGTFVTGRCGSFGGKSKALVVGGNGGWRTKIQEKQYHSDAGVKAATVIRGLAQSVGETLGAVDIDRVLGVDHCQDRGPAGIAMRAACGATPWWVDDDGVTQVGTRTISEIEGVYNVLEYDAGAKVAHVAADNVSSIRVGSVLRTKTLALHVYSVDIVLLSNSTRFACWGVDL